MNEAILKMMGLILIKKDNATNALQNLKSNFALKNNILPCQRMYGEAWSERAGGAGKARGLLRAVS